MTDSRAGIPILSFATPAQWEQWLTAEHATASALWLKIAKKGSPEATISYAEALRGALCFGWIDGQKAAYDERFWLQRFSPRKTRSRWSKINREAAIELIEAGMMQPAGLEQVQAAKDDGRWEDAYEGQRAAAVPEDLQRALQKNEPARLFFETLDSANRYAILYRLSEAKLPATRARRMQKYLKMLEAGERLHG